MTHREELLWTINAIIFSKEVELRTDGHEKSSPPMTFIVPAERRDQMATALHQFVLDAVDKYYKGQLEHGGDICDRDLVKEMRQEHIDMFHYMNGQQWKQEKNND